MIIYIDPIKNKIVKKSLSSLPVEISDKLYAVTSIKTDNNQQLYDNSGNKLYKDSLGNITILEKNVEPSDESITIDNMIINGIDLDEQIFKPKKVIYNVNYTKSASMYKEILITEKNISNFTLDEIMEKHFEKLINETNYEEVCYNILEEYNKNNSHIRDINKYKATFFPNDNLYINLNLKSVNELFISNFNDDLEIIINNNVIKNNSKIILNNQSNIILEIKNKTKNVISIINPYIYYNRGDSYESNS